MGRGGEYMKNIIIVGAGIAGLTTGIYGQLNGFNTQIFELHNIPGGECTGWKRKDYYFDGCIHWLLGTKAGDPLNNVWREVGALNDEVDIINHDLFYRYDSDGISVGLYRDVRQLESHLKAIAPEDSKRITYLCKAINALKYMKIPIAKPMDMLGVSDGLKMLVKMYPAFRYIGELDKISVQEFAAQFQSPVLREALTMLIPPYFTATSLISTLSAMSDGDAGWPVGGSRPMAKRIEEKYKSLGGLVHYRSKVKKILVQDGAAKGIQLEDGTEHYADLVISTADGHATLYEMLEGKYLDEKLKSLYSDSEAYPVYTSVQVSIGLQGDLSNYPHTRFVKLDTPVDGGGIVNDHIGFRHFSFDKTLMPQGKTALAVMLYADYDWWKQMSKDPLTYEQEKERIAQEVKALAEAYHPEIQGKIEVIDVATPLTYAKYCNAWRGAWMAWASTPKGKVRYLSGKLPGLENFYLAGQWTFLPGGLPTAVLSGRWVIQRICKLAGQKFVTG